MKFISNRNGEIEFLSRHFQHQLSKTKLLMITSLKLSE